MQRMFPSSAGIFSKAVWTLMSCPWQHIYILLLLFLSYFSNACAAFSDPQCKACKNFVTTFHRGYENTAKSNFGGGNTDWEESRLGRYSTSETRLVEILEHACTEGSDKDLCHQFVEKHEEQIEKWYFHLQSNDPDFEKWLCITTAKVCCLPDSFGPDCKTCPGKTDASPSCTGRGECEGSGTRKGKGKCRCEKGYLGEICDSCGYGYHQVEKNESFIECSDINECDLDPMICTENEYCYNTEGSYKCSKCHVACNGCTGAGAAKCRACGEGYSLVNGTCTAVSEQLFARFLHLFDKFDKTVVFCSGGAVTSFFFIKNGEYSKLALVGILMAVTLSAWHYGSLMTKPEDD